MIESLLSFLSRLLRKKLRFFVCLLLITALCGSAFIGTAEATAVPRTTRQSTIRKLPRDRKNGATHGSAFNCDTVACDSGDIVLRGFHKPLRSRREALFATNMTPWTVIALVLNLTYTDLQGRTLHQLRRTVCQTIPAGETRRLDFPSWDRQQAFYYTYSPEPPRADGTPFDVRCRVDSIMVVSPSGEIPEE